MKLQELFKSAKEMDVKFTADKVSSTVTIGDRAINFGALKIQPDPEEDRNYPENSWAIYFDEYGELEATGSGNEFEVFSYAAEFVKRLISGVKPELLIVVIDGESASRERLYDRLLKRAASELGFKLKKTEDKYGNMEYILSKSNR
jgi:hypothetical protein